MTGQTQKLLSREMTLGVIALIGLLLVGAVTAGIASAFRRQADETSELVHRLATLKSETAARPRLQIALDEARGSVSRLVGFYQGGNAGLAAAQLESDVKAIVTTNGGEVRSAQILPSKIESGVDNMAVQYDLTVPQAHLRDLLYAVESHTPYLVIADSDISVQQNWQPINSQRTDMQLEIRWTLHGFRWNRAK